MQTINVSGNEQVQFYNYEHGDGNAPGQQTGNPQTPIYPRNPSNDPNVQGDDAQNDNRILKNPPVPLGQARFLALSRQIGGVRGAVDEVNGNVNSTKADVNAVKSDVNGISTKLDGVENGVTNIAGRFASLDKSIGQINKNIDTLKTQTAQDQGDLIGIKTTLGTLVPRVGSIERETEGLKQFEQQVIQNCKISGGSGN
jgi:hypothetical protein